MDRRLTAILLTDLSGFTEFSAASDGPALEGTILQHKEILPPVISGFQGRLIKWIGDATLSTFDSAVTAILCGHEIQRRFVKLSERGSRAIVPRVKAVVHVGEVLVDADGDIYGDAVNLVARIEKVADPDEVYLSEVVQRLLPHGEIPTESVGTYDFKGVGRAVHVYRTCFGASPVIRERLILVQTNFVSLQRLADEFGWETVHPLIDETTARIVQAAREAGGTNRGVGQTGCFLSFDTVAAALRAYALWTERCAEVRPPSAADISIGVRCAIHCGTLNVMRFTMMGHDIDVVRTLSALGTGQEILLSLTAVETARAEQVILETNLLPKRVEDLRPCRSLDRWRNKFADVPVYALSPRDAAKIARREQMPTDPSLEVRQPPLPEGRVECPACGEDMEDTGRTAMSDITRQPGRIMHCSRCGNESLWSVSQRTLMP